MSQNLQNFAKFQKIQLDNLVDFEKCCKTRIFLQRSVPIQPKTNNILPKFAKNWQLPYGSTAAPRPERDRDRTGASLRALAGVEGAPRNIAQPVLHGATPEGKGGRIQKENNFLFSNNIKKSDLACRICA